MFCNILIIDKRKELSYKYKKSLETPMVSVNIAHTMAEGLEFVENYESDLLLISDSLTGNIPDFCERLRVLTYNTRPVIVVISKSSDINDRVELLERGADDFISEPVNIEEFKMRIKAHLRRDIELNLDTKTLLPDKKFTLKSLKRILFDKKERAILTVSIENYFIYKSIYSELAADKLVQSFVTIIKSALDTNDYLGQIAENEFVIITSPSVMEKLAGFLVFAFDTVAPKFYSDKDIKRGFSLLKGENCAERRIEFVYILAGGIEIDFKKFKTAEEILEHLRRIKSTAKLPTGSNYAIERLQITGNGSIIQKEFNRNIYVSESDDSLKLLLTTTLELQGYDIATDLTSETPAVLIFDAGDDLENLEKIRNLKKLREFANTKIIVTSAKHNKSAILDTKADLYLPKPYEIADLLNWVNIFTREVND